MFYHHQLRLVHNKREYVFFFIAKTGIFIGFLFIVLYTWVSQAQNFLIATGISLIVAPIASIVYSYAIFNMKCMSAGRYQPNANEQEGEQGRRRYADAADLDERQEVAIREFQVRYQNVQVDFDNRNFALGLAEAG